MSMRDEIMEVMEDGEWWTIPQLTKVLGNTNKSRYHLILSSEVKWGNVEKGEMVRLENGLMARTWRRLIR